ncbi:MAG: hypothetical protein ACOWWH_06960 [Eubacteriaceae bacterium]
MSIFDDLGKKVNKAAKVVGEKSGELVEAGKTKVETEKIEHEINKLIKELGINTYSLYKEGNLTQEALIEILVKLDEKKAKLENILNNQ